MLGGPEFFTKLICLIEIDHYFKYHLHAIVTGQNRHRIDENRMPVAVLAKDHMINPINRAIGQGPGDRTVTIRSEERRVGKECRL